MCVAVASLLTAIRVVMFLCYLLIPIRPLLDLKQIDASCE